MKIEDYHISITIHHCTRRGLLDEGKMLKMFDILQPQCNNLAMKIRRDVEDVQHVAAAVQQSRNEDKKMLKTFDILQPQCNNLVMKIRRLHTKLTK